jgi:hypothetical protein
VSIPADAQLAIAKIDTRYPTGFQCFEPMLAVLTVGIVPIHCVTNYVVTATGPELGQSVASHYKVTEMNGWLPLLLLPFPSWQYGRVEDPEAEIEGAVRKPRK